jgi:uncharacterized protein YciI
VTFAGTGAETLVAHQHDGGDVLDDPAARRRARVRGLRRPTVPEHVAFLHQVRRRGHLVAADPPGDEAGAGMTMLELPGANRGGGRHRARASSAASSPSTSAPGL